MAGRSSLTRRCNASLPLAAAVALLVLAAAQSAPARDQYDPVLRELLIDAIGAAESFDDRFTAEIWLTDMSDRLAVQVPDADERLEILRTVHFRALEAGVAPELVLAVIDVESNFDRYAISRARALGLMQVMPFWIDELDVGNGDRNVLFDIEMNVLLGCRILKHYLDVEDGDYVAGLARYNGSKGQR
ncbi:MAG: transglycosylase SLT domain-containing protein, partial [Gammaproteobacteria bacterium]